MPEQDERQEEQERWSLEQARAGREMNMIEAVRAGIPRGTLFWRTLVGEEED